MMHGSHLHYLVFLSLLVLSYGCMTADPVSEQHSRKQVHIDANLLFEVSYPEDWMRTRRPINQDPLTNQTTTWRMGRNDSEKIQPELSILSLPAEHNPYSYNGLETIINEQTKNLIINERETIKIPVGSVIKLTGVASQSTYKIWLYLGEQRHYVITCSSATTEFKKHQEQFQEIIESFRVIK